MSRIYSLSILAALWTAWCFMHSLLISSGVSSWMKKRLGRKFGYYRSGYNIFSLLSLAPVIYFYMNLEEKVVFSWPWPWNIVKYGMYTAAFLLFYGGYRIYDLQYMLGTRQIHAMRQGSSTATMKFTTEGILGYVRHPWYSGAIILIWAFGTITDVSLVSKIVLTIYILIGTLLEEKKLIREIGDPYRAYRKRVPMLIPWKKN